MNEQLARHALLAENQKLYNRHQGERCFILATGPSINSQSLRDLAGQTCISVSNFFVHPDCSAIRPRYHCVAPFHPPITEEAWQTWLAEMADATGDAELFFGMQDRQPQFVKRTLLEPLGPPRSFGGPLNQLEAHGVDLAPRPSRRRSR